MVGVGTSQYYKVISYEDEGKDGWERESERGMLRETGGIFIEAAVFIATQRGGLSVAGLGGA